MILYILVVVYVVYYIVDPIVVYYFYCVFLSLSCYCRVLLYVSCMIVLRIEVLCIVQDLEHVSELLYCWPVGFP